MNLIDATVVKVNGPPVFMWRHWWVAVTYESEGVESKQSLMFKTEDEAKAVDVGFKFLA